MKHIIRLANAALIAAMCVLYAQLTLNISHKPAVIAAAILLTANFLRILAKPSLVKNSNIRLKSIYNGRELLVIYVWSWVFHIAVLLMWKTFAEWSAAWFAVYLTLMFVSGAVITAAAVIRLVVSSARLGIVTRLMLILLWWVPIVNVFVIMKASDIAYREYELETQRNELNDIRKESEMCKTKYPILMVHGVFFRDMKYLNYWGRIPRELIRNGAQVYYGNQQSAASVEDSAAELAERITEIVNTTGCGKVNIIAHSKGGLDARYALSALGMDKYTASLTTVCTPHRGCGFADFLLKKSSYALKLFIARHYNDTLKKLGDKSPDFLSAVSDLTEENCRLLNATVTDKEGVLYQSIGTNMKNSKSAGFPLNITYKLAAKFSSLDNDGLVDVESMKWGESFRYIEPQTKRGISHGDMIDLFREDIKGFDVREEYVQIVSGLKQRGL